MMYAKYALLVVADLFVSFLNLFLAPFVVLFANDAGFLPNWLYWFQTPGDSLDHDYHNKRFPGPQTGWRRWFSRAAWLYRNSMYGFAIEVLGAKTKGTDLRVTYGDDRTSNRPIHSGYVHYELYRDGKLVYFQYYLVIQWCETRCLRVNIGWKLWGFEPGVDKNCQLTFSPNPFMGLSNPVQP